MCCCGWQYGIAQDADTILLLKQRASAQTDSARFSLTIDLHNACFRTHPEQSKAYADQMLEMAWRNDDWYMKYQSYRALSRYYTKLRDYSYVFRYNELAYQAAIKINDPEKVFTAAMARANAYIDAEIPGKGFFYLKTARAFAVSHNDTNKLAMVERSMAMYYDGLNDHVQTLGHFQKALSFAKHSKDERLTADIGLLMTSSMIKLGKFREATDILYQSLEYYKSVNSIYRQAFAYSQLGKIQVINGAPEQGIKYYEQAGELYLRHNNTTDYALLLTELSGILMSRKLYKYVPRYLHLADSLLTLTDYPPGRAVITLKSALYFSERGSFIQADSLFRQAATLIEQVKDYPPSLIDINFVEQAKSYQYSIEFMRALVSHYFRQNGIQEGDSLMFSVASLIAAVKDPETINEILYTIESWNPGLDSQMLRMIRVLYAAGGTKKIIKNLSGTESLSAIMPVQFLTTLNPYTFTSDSLSGEMISRYNRAFAELYIRNRVGEMSDSLLQDIYYTEITRQKLKTSKYTITGVSTALILLSVILGLVVRDRKRQAQLRTLEKEKRILTERDRQQLYNLYTHGNHNSLNHMVMLSSIVQDINNSGDITERGADRLSQKITTLYNLYDCLYMEDAPAGDVNLRRYIPKLCSHLAELYRESADISAVIEEDIWLTPRNALILGTIITELTVNSCKHAFRDKKGAASIVLVRNADMLTLDYRDNGTGITGMREGSQGIAQIQASVQHLEGTAGFHNDNGLHFSLIFPHE